MTDLIMGNGGPAQVADAVVNEIRARERNGIVQLPQRPPPRRGDPVRVWRGLFAGQLGLFQGMRGSERVIVLLQALGHVTLPRDDVEVV